MSDRARVALSGDDGGVDRPSGNDVVMDAVTFGMALDAFRPQDMIAPPGSSNVAPPWCPVCSVLLHPIRTNPVGDTHFACLNDHENTLGIKGDYHCVYRVATRTFEPLPGREVKDWKPPVVSGQRLKPTKRRGAPRATAAAAPATAPAPAPEPAAVELPEEVKRALAVVGVSPEDYAAKLRQAAETAAAPPKRRAKIAAEAPPAPPALAAADMLSLHAAAKFTGLARSTLRARAERGKVVGAVRSEEGWRFPVASLAEHVARPEAK